jgi:predicted XRE-type DNA-binding protein
MTVPAHLDGLLDLLAEALLRRIEGRSPNPELLQTSSGTPGVGERGAPVAQIQARGRLLMGSELHRDDSHTVLVRRSRHQVRRTAAGLTIAGVIDVDGFKAVLIDALVDRIATYPSQRAASRAWNVAQPTVNTIANRHTQRLTLKQLCNIAWKSGGIILLAVSYPKSSSARRSSRRRFAAPSGSANLEVDGKRKGETS